MTSPLYRKTLFVTAVAVVALMAPAPANAHCDTLDGPVITEARAALEAGDVTPVLKWVGPDDEDEIRATFTHVMQVRLLGDEARALADRFFFETLVRIHRAGEGAPYTGLKPGASGTHAAEAAADRALAEDSVDALAAKIAERAAGGVRQRFAATIAAREHADDSIAAGREYVEAYVTYVHYVLAVHNAIEGAGGDHHTGEAAPAPTAASHVH